MKQLIRSTLVLSTGLLIAAPAIGDPVPDWVNSYSDGEACYCAPDLDSSLARKMVPTPVGGKSIGQICERVGTGPGLSLANGEFNHPVYTDAQCGNGPVASSTEASEDCEGRLAEDDIICQGIGPAWNLKQAFAKKSKAVETKKTAVAQTPTPVKTETAKAGTPVVKVEPRPRVILAPASESDIPLATVVDSKAVAEANTALPAQDAVSSTNVSSGTAVEQLPLATVVSTQSSSTASEESAEVEKLPAAQIVSTRVVSEPATSGADASAKFAAGEKPQSNESTEAADTRTFIVRAPDTDSGAVLIEQSNEDVVNTVANEEKPDTSGDLTDVATTDTGLPSSVDTATATQSNNTEATEVVADSVGVGADTTSTPVNAGLRIDAGFERPGVRFNYVQLAPINFDFGGSGASVEASFSQQQGWGVVGRGSLAESYSEFMLGVAHTSRAAQLNGATTTLTVGAESGEFDLDVTDFRDSGAFVSGTLGYDFTHRLQGQGGVSYSTFFDGDPSVFGLLLLHATPALDIAGRVELGDNDNFSVGLRFHY